MLNGQTVTVKFVKNHHLSHLQSFLKMVSETAGTSSTFRKLTNLLRTNVSRTNIHITRTNVSVIVFICERYVVLLAKNLLLFQVARWQGCGWAGGSTEKLRVMFISV